MSPQMQMLQTQWWQARGHHAWSLWVMSFLPAEIKRCGNRLAHGMDCGRRHIKSKHRGSHNAIYNIGQGVGRGVFDAEELCWIAENESIFDFSKGPTCCKDVHLSPSTGCMQCSPSMLIKLLTITAHYSKITRCKVAESWHKEQTKSSLNASHELEYFGNYLKKHPAIFLRCKVVILHLEC